MTTEKLIINGVDHSVFNLEWAKRGGVVFCVNKFSKDLMLGNVVVGVHDIAWFISVSYQSHQSPNSDWRRCSASSGERLNQFANIRMATPAECEAAGVEYIKRPVSDQSLLDLQRRTQAALRYAEKLRGIFHVSMLKAYPQKSHQEISDEIDNTMKEVK